MTADACERLDAVRRAAEARRRILERLAVGDVALMSNVYLFKPEYKSELIPGGKACAACAIGTLALSLKDDFRANNFAGCVDAVGELVTREEAGQIEAGFEGDNAAWFGHAHPDRSSPFYKLGEELRARRDGHFDPKW